MPFPCPPSSLSSPVYVLLLLINFFLLFYARCCSPSPPPLCFCLLREESASYGFYSLVVPPSRIPLSSPSNQPFFFLLPLSLVSIPYASSLLPLFVFSPPSWRARLTLHQAKEQSKFPWYSRILRGNKRLRESMGQKVNTPILPPFPSNISN